MHFEVAVQRLIQATNTECLESIFLSWVTQLRTCSSVRAELLNGVQCQRCLSAFVSRRDYHMYQCVVVCFARSSRALLRICKKSVPLSMDLPHDDPSKFCTLSMDLPHDDPSEFWCHVLQSFNSLILAFSRINPFPTSAQVTQTIG